VLITGTTEYPRVPGMKHITAISYPFKTPGKVHSLWFSRFCLVFYSCCFRLICTLFLQNELQYQNDYAGLSLGVGMNSKPLINFSGVVGNKSVAVGGDVAYDTAIGDWTKYNAGVSLTKEDLVASMML
jgi:voltage-dependent anion channel protein 2